MTTIRRLLVAASLAVALGSIAAPTRAAEESESSATASIRLSGRPTKPERAAAAKISFDDALLAAHRALPGRVVNGALEVEDGNLQYAFEVLNAKTGKIDEVAIDAGNGRVLSIDRDDKD
jgi:uncharacterized membrane protein YkoI